jgi:choice-of-anchor B domain-containing protein
MRSRAVLPVLFTALALLVLPGSAMAGHGVGMATPIESLRLSQERANMSSFAEAPELPAGQSFACENGMAGPFPCENVDLESMVPLGGAGLGTGNDVWGWTDPQTGREYGIVSSALATSFVDVTDPKNPQTVGYLPTEANPLPDFVLWRDVKVNDNHAFVVSEITGHGMQVFDLTRLRGATGVPQIFTPDTVYRGMDDTGQSLGNVHNIAVNEETDFAYAVGSNTCDALGATGENGGMHMIDISDPKNPEFAGCARVTDPPENNYVHDVQCVIYRGPDAAYQGREICFGSNENVVTIYDVTDKSNPVVISQTGYPQASYTHQGWLTSDQRFFLFGDELDEQGGTVTNTATYVMEANSLEDPADPKVWLHETNSIDHNLFIDKGLAHESNYGAGLRILDYNTASLQNGSLTQVGFFDVRPEVDVPEFIGTWSNYPYFESGIVLASVIEDGASTLYVLRPTGPAANGEDPSTTGKQKKPKKPGR